MLLDRAFRLDLPTLSKLNFYVFVPALSFVKLLEARISSFDMMTVGLFSFTHLLLMLALSWGLFSFRAFRSQKTILTMGSIFYNAGNFGIPLTALAFGANAVGIIAIVLVVQNFLNFTIGIWLFEHKANDFRRVLAGMAKVPVVYAVIVALLLRGLTINLPTQLMSPLRYLSDGLIPIALITLGVQLARTRLSSNLLPLTSVTVMRLLVSPMMAAVLALIFGFGAHLSQILIVAAGFPVAVNVYLLAAEYQQGEELASQSIFISTLLSAVTLSILLLFFQH